MSGMTGVNLHINEAKVLANECISNIEQCRRKKIVLLDKLLDEHLRAYEKLDWFSRLLGDVPSRSSSSAQVQRRFEDLYVGLSDCNSRSARTPQATPRPQPRRPGFRTCDGSACAGRFRSIAVNGRGGSHS
jgi:hypothetical protein